MNPIEYVFAAWKKGIRLPPEVVARQAVVDYLTEIARNVITPELVDSCIRHVTNQVFAQACQMQDLCMNDTLAPVLGQPRPAFSVASRVAVTEPAPPRMEPFRFEFDVRSIH